GRPAEAGSYTTAFGRVADRLERQVAELKRVRRQAREDLRELVALAPAARLRRIVNSRTRFRSRALAELLLEESRERVRNDPRLAAELAELVPHVLLWTPGAVEQDWARELDLLARARRGNALRVAGDLHAADRGFAALHQRTDCPLPPETAAELASLEASLRLDQRRFDDADALLDKAARLFRKAGVEEGLARVLVQRGILHRHAGRLPEAGRALDEAMQLLDPEHQTHLFLCAAGTLVLCLCESGELTAAHRMLRAQSALFEKVMDDWWALRLRVIEGRVLLALGDSSAAVRRFAEAREGYLARGAFLDAAVTCLDLALAYLALGQTTELKQLAAESAPVFRSVALQREALAAVRLFQQAAAAEHLTAAAVCHLRDVLEHARGQTPPAS
ncbi:MAG TPA: hypothetical protein VHQ65_00480, partial [Thermoanaerobaculia bacterium]|nr:hypothetical protein [Thermoanaerobaculia bacterium]